MDEKMGNRTQEEVWYSTNAVFLYGELNSWVSRNLKITGSLGMFWQSKLDEIFEDAKKEWLKYPSLIEMTDDLFELERIEIYENYPRVLWSSIFISTFHSFESLLTRMCDLSPKDICKIRFKEYTTRSRGVGKVYSYLKDNGLEHELLHWTEVLSLKSLRNAIVHNDGNLHGIMNEEKLREYLSKNEYVWLEDDNFIYFNHNFIGDAIYLMFVFLEEVHVAIFSSYWNDMKEENLAKEKL